MITVWIQAYSSRLVLLLLLSVFMVMNGWMHVRHFVIFSLSEDIACPVEEYEQVCNGRHLANKFRAFAAKVERVSNCSMAKGNWAHRYINCYNILWIVDSRTIRIVENLISRSAAEEESTAKYVSCKFLTVRTSQTIATMTQTLGGVAVTDRASTDFWYSWYLNY